MARDLIASGHQPSADIARRALFQFERLSLGNWQQQIVGASLAPAILRHPTPTTLFIPEIASDFVRLTHVGAIKSQLWLTALGDWIAWRNRGIGHGAFRLDMSEY